MTSLPPRRARVVAALALVVGLGAACSSDPDPTGGEPSPARAEVRTDAQVLAETTATVARAVEEAEAEAPLPTTTSPRLGDDLNLSRADLGECDYGDYDTSSGPLCARGDVDADRTLVVLGDSHGRHWVPALDQVAEATGWTAYYLVKQQCTAATVPVGDPREARPTQPWAACRDFNAWALDQVAELDPDLVVVSTSPPVNGVFTGDGLVRDPAEQVEPYRRGFDRLFAALEEASDARTVLLKDVPVRAVDTDPETCLVDPTHDLGDCLSGQFAEQGFLKLTQATVRSAAAAGVDLVDPTPLFCWQAACPVVIGDGLLPYRGRSHITVEYAATLAEPLGSLLDL